MKRSAVPVVQLVTAVLSSATSVAVSLSLVASGWGPWVLSLCLVMGILPGVVFAPVLAPLLDTAKLPRLTSVLQLLEAVVLVCGALYPEPLVLLGMVLLTGTSSCLTAPALMALSRRAGADVGDHSARAFAWMDAARLSGMFVGPVLGGLLFDVTSVSVVIVIEAVVLCGVATAVRRLPVGEVDRAACTATWWSRASEAPRLLGSDPLLRRSMVVLATGVVFTAVFSVADILLVTQTLGLNGLGYAVIVQAFVVGRLLGAGTGARITRDRAVIWLYGGGLLMGAGLVLAGTVAHPVSVGAGFFVAGVANALQVAAIRMVFVRVLPDHVMAKALSSLGPVNNAAMVVGVVAAAPLIGLVGAAGALVVAGVGTAVVTLMALISGPRQVRVERLV